MEEIMPWNHETVVPSLDGERTRTPGEKLLVEFRRNASHMIHAWSMRCSRMVHVLLGFFSFEVHAWIVSDHGTIPKFDQKSITRGNA